MSWNASILRLRFRMKRQKEKMMKYRLKPEVIPLKVDSESVLLTLSSSGNEIKRSNEDDVVGISIDAGAVLII